MDWWVHAIMMVGCLVIGARVYSDFAKNSGKLMPTVSELESLRSELTKQQQELHDECQKLLAELDTYEKKIDMFEPERQALQGQVNEKEMIEIPAGSFLMGSYDGGVDESPEREVFLDSYLIDKYPVTNQEYKLFVDVTGQRLPPHWSGGSYPMGEGNHPVVNVSWDDAFAYAQWVSKRLPTEAEWEKASRGTDGRVYPWGDAFRKDQINAGNNNDGTMPVNKFPDGKSIFGVMDMCGNAQEWCSDWYDHGYYSDGPLENPKGPMGGQTRVVRGGGYVENSAGVRCSARHQAAQASLQDNIGFRCANDLVMKTENI